MVGQPGNPGLGSPELTPQSNEAPRTTPEVADFSRQVELYKSNLQQKFNQKALETGVSVMALAANVPGLKDASSFIRGARAILGTATAGMLGGDLGRQIGLSNFSAEQGRRAQDFLEKTKQFFHEDGSSKALSDDERLAAEELRAEMTKQLEVSAAVAKTTEHHKLFGRMIEEELDQSATESKGWGKEKLLSMASGIRSILQTDIGAKAKALASAIGKPETQAMIGKNTLALLSAGRKNWKSLAVIGSTFGAVWLAPAMAPLVMTATTSVNLWRKGSQLRELRHARNEAEERVQAYQSFSLERVHSVNQLAEQILKLDKAMGRATDGQTIETMLATVLQDVSRDTYQDIAKAVKQASARGAGLGLAAGAAMYGIMGHRQEPTSTPAPTTHPFGFGGAPDSPTPALPEDRIVRTGSGESFIHQQSDVVYGKPIPVEERPSRVEFNPDAAGGGTNNPMQPTQEQSSETWRGGESGTIPETVKVGDKLQLDINGDGSTETKGIQETYEVKQDASGRKYIAMLYMDTNGDGRFDTLKPSVAEVAQGIKQKYVKVFVDRATGGGGYLGYEVNVMAGGKEVVKNTLWVGDKDEWMRNKVGTDTWNTIRERIKSSVGINNHETKGWGFVARRGPLASLESMPTNLAGLQGSALEAAVRGQVPEIQVTNELASGRFSGNWLGGRGFTAEFTNAAKLPQIELDALTKGWPSDSMVGIERGIFGVDATSFEFHHFSVAGDKLRAFSKALLYNPSGLPSDLKDTLRDIHIDKKVASDALLGVLKASEKHEFTLDDLRQLAKTAKQTIATGKG